METSQGTVRKPPAVIIIARHGARIDAVDKDWHLTSPTPYDPPLTYGGWLQGRALGARIASLLKAREEIVEHNDNTPSASGSKTPLSSSSTTDTTPEENHQRGPKKVRKHNVIIHSSPFLRCTQTSVAISAGISQHYRAENEQSVIQAATPSNPASEDISPLTTPPRSSTPTSDQWAKGAGKDRSNGQAKRAKSAPRTRLRIDGLLGEWLSPDYYDQITPPPGSVAMVAGAKVELRRRGETLHSAHHSGSISSYGNFPGGWKSNQSPTSPDMPNENGSFGMSALAEALPAEKRGDDGLNRNRSIKGITIRDVLSRTPSHSLEDYSEGYIPPVPSYAISKSDPIPTGYVAHARDACVDVDFQWDSMSAPQNWGDGGEYGEEWSSMHKRFRNGLVKMIEWYSHEQPQNAHHHRHHHHHVHAEDDDTDTVLVLVTHGAGCNALIGALTNQPVLIDVAMASLTMAVHKDALRIKSSGHPSAGVVSDTVSEQRVSPFVAPLYQTYDVSLVASVEHLRATSTSKPMAIPQLQAPTPAPALERSRSKPAYRHRADSNPIQFTTKNNDTTNKAASQNQGLHRSATTNSSSHHQTRNGSGLWSAATATLPPKKEQNGIAPVRENGSQRSEPRDRSPPLEIKRATEPNLRKPHTAGEPNTQSPSSSSSSNQVPDQPPQEQPKAPLGLWSSSSAAIAQAREPTMKRRWTVTDPK